MDENTLYPQGAMRNTTAGPGAALARELGVSDECIGNIRRGRTWKHVVSRPWR